MQSALAIVLVAFGNKGLMPQEVLKPVFNMQFPIRLC